MINRLASDKVRNLAGVFKSVALLGPRQSGKTTLVKSLFPDKKYVSLENPDTRKYAQEDPRGFLEANSEGAIFDEIQLVPDLFAYLQERLDNTNESGKFILTGSNNYLLQQNITQSLAGRVAMIQLLPFSVLELFAPNQKPEINELLIKGLYPPVHDRKIAPEDWYPNYIRTYIERDVRQIKNITDLIIFERFMRLLAGRTGHELNLTSLALEAGVDTKTIQSWIGILESSFIIFLLRPYYRNFNKVIIKRPKVYFYDTGLVCSLLGLTDARLLENNPIKGNLFETMIVSELYKKKTNQGKVPNYFFWRDKTGHEIDVIADEGTMGLPIEIKSGKTINDAYTDNLVFYQKLTGQKKGWVIYNGNQTENRSNGISIQPWLKFLHDYPVTID